jgi:zinc protease
MTPIHPEHLKTLPGADNTSRMILSNGIVVLVRKNENSPSVVISGYFPAGSMFDPREKLGLAYFTSLSLMRGTQTYSFHDIYNQLETAGASLGFGASVHTLNFGGRGLVEDLPLLVDLLSSCLREPVFPQEHVDRMRTQLLTALNIRAQDTAEMASLAFDEILFGEHPYGLPEDGYLETMELIQRADLEAFHHQYYAPNQMVVVVVGAVEPAQVFDLLQARLGDWQPAAQSAPLTYASMPACPGAVRRHIFLPEKTQVDLVMGTRGPRRTDENYLTASVGNNILGQFGMMGRIGESVRENAGLAYYASTGLNAWIEGGSWEVSAGVDPNNLDQAIALIREEILRFTREPVSADELSDSQAYFLGRLPLRMESNAGMANALLNIERFQLGLEYYREYPGLIEAITPEAILETARQYLDADRFVVVSAGPEVG